MLTPNIVYVKFSINKIRTIEHIRGGMLDNMLEIDVNIILFFIRFIGRIHNRNKIERNITKNKGEIARTRSFSNKEVASKNEIFVQ